MNEKAIKAAEQWTKSWELYWAPFRIKSLAALLDNFAADARKDQEEYAIGTEEWNGIVTKIGSISFSAVLIDLNEDDFEEHEFLIEEVSSQDLPLLKTGAVFRWVIAYQSGRKIMSQLRFGRPSMWSKIKEKLR